MRALADRVRAVLALLGPLGAGSRVLLLRLIERFGWKTVGMVAATAGYAAFRYRTWIVWGIAAWCAAAWMHAPTATMEPGGEEPEPAGEEPADPDPCDVTDLLRDLIGDDRGILLTALSGPLHAPDTRAVREVLAAAGIRVRDGVRTVGGNGPGVHRADLPPLPPTEQDTPNRPLTCTNNANNTLTVTSREGLTIITDPADRHRTHTLNKP